MKKASIALVMMTTLAISFQAQSISLVHLPPIRRKLPSLPRVRAGKLVSEKARKAINRHLEHQDAAVRFEWNDCAVVSLNGGIAEGTWERKVSITQRGPKFLSLLVDDFAVCGASPTTYRFPLVYRLSDGHSIDWAEFLPSSATISKGPDGGDEGMQQITWPELDHLAKEQATSENAPISLAHLTSHYVTIFG